MTVVSKDVAAGSTNGEQRRLKLVRDKQGAAHPNDEMPQCPDAERAVLGSMLLDPNSIEKTTKILVASDFHPPKHRIHGLLDSDGTVV